MAINYEKKDHTVIVTINRPDEMNCLDKDDMDALGRAWIDFRDDDRLWVGILTGAGEKAFCSGADLRKLIPKVCSGEVTILPTEPAFLKNIRCFKPIIAAVNGVCLAGGMEILQGTDIRIAVERATFGLPEVKWGIFPGAGSTVRLPRQIPFCRAMEILLLGAPITAQQALEIGLINSIVRKEELMNTAVGIAERLCKNGPLAIRAIKESVLKSFIMLEEHAYFSEAFLANQVFRTDDAIEGATAFAEKRKPVFTAT
jgi:enoyl-CoA hydratase